VRSPYGTGAQQATARPRSAAQAGALNPPEALTARPVLLSFPHPLHVRFDARTEAPEASRANDMRHG
jgi:hypothetical protein